jgi:Fic family protein
MVTKYDAFEIVYKNRALIKPIEIVKRLNKNKKDYHAIHKQLRELAKEKLLIKKESGFQAETNDKAKMLYSLIQYCLKNGINYNLLLDKNLADFISKALQKNEINSKNIKLNPRTLKNYIDILDKFGLVLVISEKPLRVKIFYNILLNNLLVYFGYKDQIITEDNANYLKEIEKEIETYKRLRKKNELGYQKIVSEFEISFVYHSLSLEGNPITLPDTLKILRDDITPSNLKSKDIEELKNYKDAIAQMLKDTNEGKQLSLQAVLDYHFLLKRHEPEIAGKIRQIPVHIRGNPNFKVARPEEIREKLESLFEKYNEFIKKRAAIKEILAFASFFHNEFQHIHPFEDGNSRTTRLITFHLLQSKGVPILDIPFGLLDEYMSYTKSSRKREDNKLYSNLQKIILFNLRRINKILS